ncbi:MAG: cryptochrome/photolyase family protein [Cytophagales bacterium]|nr:MAG: cryptochrome/photolyase family protein [Cytophagales bacterium]
MNKAFLVLPHQLFEDNFSISGNYIFVLIEDFLYFKQYNFHQQKLVLHRASMQYYKAQLIKKDKEHIYIEHHSFKDYEDLFIQLKERSIFEIHYRDLNDDWLEQRVRQASISLEIKLIKWNSPYFLCNEALLSDYFKDKKHFSMSNFYAFQRTRLEIMVDESNSPLGGKWSYDNENRKKLPKNVVIPARKVLERNKYVIEALSYVNRYFSNNIGSTDAFSYATTHAEAKSCMIDFFDSYFQNFGLYEDAIAEKNSFLFHSILSPYLNIGLLVPEEVISEALKYEKEIPINSMEGFIRQIIGWREFMKAAYLLKGRKIRTSNFWKFDRPLSDKFYSGTTGLLPVDNAIKNLHSFAYNHHIERLMVLGNIMLLCEINPNNVYQWFMEMYIDSYDWVMVPNVYSMSQFACGGLLTTKPYLSGSNYILKMSDYPKGEWCKIWDGLYWRFIHKHRAFFLKNPRLSMMARLVEQMPEEKLLSHYEIAEDFLKTL